MTIAQVCALIKMFLKLFFLQGLECEAIFGFLLLHNMETSCVRSSLADILLSTKSSMFCVSTLAPLLVSTDSVCKDEHIGTFA